jgi:hypothetical protein
MFAFDGVYRLPHLSVIVGTGKRGLSNPSDAEGGQERPATLAQISCRWATGSLYSYPAVSGGVYTSLSEISLYRQSSPARLGPDA